jgi:hypothetical protein
MNSQIENTNRTQIQIGTEDTQNNREENTQYATPQPSDDMPKINDTYTGEGTTLNYTIQANGYGNASALKAQPTLQNGYQNQTTFNVPLPNASIATNLSLSVSDISRLNTTTKIIEDQLEYSPKINIIYTKILNTTDPTTAQIGISINNTDAVPVQKVEIYFNNTLNETYNDLDLIYHNEDFPAETGITNVTVLFFFGNGTLCANETFPIEAQTELATQNETIFLDNRLLNPIFRIHTNQYQKIAWNMTIQEDTNLTSISVYTKYQFQSFGSQLRIEVRKDSRGGTLIEEIVFNLFTGIPFSDQWFTIPFNLNGGGINLTAGNYFVILDGSNIIPDNNTNYFDLFGYTYNEFHNSSWYNGSEWVSLNHDILFQYTIQEYIPTDLTDYKIDTIVGDKTGQFNASVSTLNFTWTQLPYPTGLLSIIFTANWSLRFNITYTVAINQTQLSPACSFIIGFPGNLVTWNTTIGATRPRDAIDATFYHEYNYTLYFPNRWNNFNATTENHLITTPDPVIGINSSTVHLNWTFQASSIGQPMNLSGTDGRNDYAPAMNISAEGYFNSRVLNATLTYWNASFDTTGQPNEGFYLPNSTSSRQLSTTNQSLTLPARVIFDDFLIPENYTNIVLTARIWWNNLTDAGIVFQNFSIFQFADLIVYNKSVYLELNGSVIVECEYVDKTGAPILNANVFVNWTAGNWTNVTMNGRYYITIFENNTNLGDRYQILINFSHPVYVNRWDLVNLTIYNYINTTLALIEADSSVYLGQYFDLAFSWLRWDGATIDIANVTATLQLDGQPVPSEHGGVTLALSPINVWVQIRTNRFYGQNFVGVHRIDLNLTKADPNSEYQSRAYTYYFEVRPIPGKLALNNTSGTFVNPTYVQQYARNSNGLRLDMNYFINETYENTIGDLSLYKSGEIYGRIFDLTLNQSIGELINFTNIRDGSYRAIFPTFTLIPSHIYEIRLFANQTDFTFLTYTIKLEILMQFDTIIQYTGPQTVLEKKVLSIEGAVYMDNGSHQIPAVNTPILVNVTYLGPKGNESYQFTIYTDENGIFTDTHLIVGDFNQFSLVEIVFTYQGSDMNLAKTFSIRLLIEQDMITRLVIPLVIIIGTLAIVIPVFAKYGWPFLNKRYPKAKIIQQLQKLPVINKILEKKEESAPDPLEQINELRVPKVGFQEDSVSKVNPTENVEFDVIPIKNPDIVPELEQRQKTIKILGTTIQRPIEVLRNMRRSPLMKKELYLNDAANLERKGELFMALLQYTHALDMARKSGPSDEAQVIDSRIKQLLVTMPIKEQIEFLKIRQRMGVE